MRQRMLERDGQQLRGQVDGQKLRVRFDVRLARHHRPRRTGNRSADSLQGEHCRAAEFRFHSGTLRDSFYSQLDTFNLFRRQTSSYVQFMNSLFHSR